MTPDLDEWRARIDVLNAKLVDLLNERARCALEIAAFKSKNNLPVHDPKREKEVLEKVVNHNGGPLTDDALRDIFRCIMAEHRKLEEEAESNPQKTLVVVGLGLIGASIAEATRKRYPGWKIVGVSSMTTIREAMNGKLIDEGVDYPDVHQAMEQADIAFVCTPIDNILGLLGSWVEKPLRLKPGAIVSDVGSTKTVICNAAKKVFPADGNGVFVGSHPMAGSEKTGLKARDAHLFENAAWILCPDKDASAKVNEARETLEKFIQGLGARTLILFPQNHDLIVAMASHLPQILSTALAAYVGGSESFESVLEVAGGGLRDMTRLAASSFAVWEPILRTNRKNLEFILPTFRRELEALEISLSRDGGEQFFEEANDLRGKFSSPRKGFTSPTTEILVDLEDKPGALLAVLSPVAQAGINVLDLEILKVREGEEGVLMMGFGKPEEAKAALNLLGPKARLR